MSPLRSRSVRFLLAAHLFLVPPADANASRQASSAPPQPAVPNTPAASVAINLKENVASSVKVESNKVARPAADFVQFILVQAKAGGASKTISCEIPTCDEFSIPLHLELEEPSGCGASIDATIIRTGSTVALDADVACCAGSTGAHAFAQVILAVDLRISAPSSSVIQTVNPNWTTDTRGFVNLQAVTSGVAGQAEFEANQGSIRTNVSPNTGSVQSDTVTVGFRVNLIGPSGGSMAGRGRVGEVSFGPTPASIAIDSPSLGGGEEVVGGENFTIRWTSTGDVGDVRLLLKPTAIAEPTTIAIVLEPGPTDEFVWSVPTDVISREAQVVVESFANSSVSSTSGLFSIRQYALARPTSDGFERFTPDQHGWSFDNTACGNQVETSCTDIVFVCPDGSFDCLCVPEQQFGFWPPTWYSRAEFDYVSPSGRDPFTEQPYNLAGTPTLFPLVLDPVNAYPDWPSFASAFGRDDAYFVQPDSRLVYRESFVESWFDAHGRNGFSGACLGMAVSALANFLFPSRFADFYLPVTPELFDQPMTDGVRRAINRMQVYDRAAAKRTVADRNAAKTPRQTLEDLKRQLLSDDFESYGVLRIGKCGFTNGAGACVDESGGTITSSGHALLPYKMERTDFTPGTGKWRIFVYDPNNAGGTTQFVDIDSTGRSGDERGLWHYDHNNALCQWGGVRDLYLLDPIDNYLKEAEPIVSTLSRGAGPVSAAEGIGQTAIEVPLYVATAPGADIRIVADNGETVGCQRGKVFNTIAGAVPEIPTGGIETAPTVTPYGYVVPRARYGITMARFPSGSATAAVHDVGHIYSYSREDADSTDTDHLTFEDASLRVGSGDTGVRKVIALRAIVDETTRERVFDVRNLTLNGADSVRIAIVDDVAGQRLNLKNTGGPKSYTLTVREGSSAGGKHFHHVDVPLSANATHLIRPDWTLLDNGTVDVDVDRNGDAEPDTTLALTDQTTATLLSLVSASAQRGRVRLTWLSANPRLIARVMRSTDGVVWARLTEVAVNAVGQLVFEDTDVTGGVRYGYRLVQEQGGNVVFLAETWVTVPGALELALAGARPNPTSQNLSVAFTLTDASPARVELLDPAGRRVLSREVGALGSGSHVVRLAEGRSVPPGVYHLRLTTKGRSLLARVVIIR